MSIQTINPATGEIIRDYPEMSAAEVNDIIAKTHQAFLAWAPTDFATRAAKMQKLASLLRKNQLDYAKIITQEMGKPIAAAKSEIEKCAWVCDYYAEHAADYLKPQLIKTEMQKSYVIFQPQGIVFAIMPWNFPFWQVFRFAAPNIMAGNSAILKHAPISTGAALAIEKLFREADFPTHLFSTIIVDTDLAAAVIKHPNVIAVTLTGSGQAGKSVASAAAQALKKAVLELGGSDPYIVLEDADLDLAADEIIKSRMNNSGQVCISAKRIIAVAAVRPALEKKILAKLEAINMGDPMDEKINFGPLARADLRDQVAKQVQQSIDKGATLLTGGKPVAGKGFYYPPTVLKNVRPGMPAYDDEIFGPVIAFIDASDEQDAIMKANDTRYGLSAAVFTKDIARGEKIAADKIRTGTCYVNGMVASDPRLPFGGIKESGFGRELAAEGIREFMNVKTVCVK